MPFLEPGVSFSSNFELLFSVIRHNSSFLFHLKLYMLWANGAHQSATIEKFATFHCFSFRFLTEWRETNRELSKIIYNRTLHETLRKNRLY